MPPARIRYVLPALVFVGGLAAQAQTPQQQLLGSWVKTKLQAKSGEELPITFRSKAAYLRFSFYPGGRGYKSLDFRDKGFPLRYSLQPGKLTFGINTYQVEALDSTRLVLLEEARPGYDEPAVRSTFVRESVYRRALPAEREVAVGRRGRLVYKESEKLSPELQLSESLDELLDHSMSARHETAKENGFFAASFIILPSGRLDTIQIHKGRNATYDRQFIKAIQKTDGQWKMPTLDGQAVAIEKEVRFQFFTFAGRMHYENKFDTGVKLLRQREYGSASLFFSECIQLNPNDVEPYYQRALCYLASSQPQNACTDWQRIKALGSHDADEWLGRFCR